MKKALIFLSILVCFILIMAIAAHFISDEGIPLSYGEKIEVSLYKTVDGDTTWFTVNGKSEKVRYLAIDTRETYASTGKAEEIGFTAKDYLTEILDNADKLEIELDPGSDERDKYDRLLAWVWADGELVQKELVEQGLAEVKYIYGDYLYTDELNKAQDAAKKARLGIWSEENSTED